MPNTTETAFETVTVDGVYWEIDGDDYAGSSDGNDLSCEGPLWADEVNQGAVISTVSVTIKARSDGANLSCAVRISGLGANYKLFTATSSEQEFTFSGDLSYWGISSFDSFLAGDRPFQVFGGQPANKLRIPTADGVVTSAYITRNLQNPPVTL